MISKYMKAIVDKLISANFAFINATSGGVLENAIGAFWEALDSESKEAAKMRMVMLTRLNYYKPDSTDIIVGSDLYRCPDAEQVMLAGIFSPGRVYDAYGTHDINIEGKTVRLLNNYGDEDGVDVRVGNNHAWYSPCIMYEQNGRLVFELVDLVVPKEEFGLHKPYAYRHAIANTDIPASFKENIGFGKRAFFYGKNWLLSKETQEQVFSIRHCLDAKDLEQLGIPVTKKTGHIKLGEINLCVSDGMLIIPANEAMNFDVE